MEKYDVNWTISPVDTVPTETEIDNIMKIIRHKATKTNAFSIGMRKEMYRHLSRQLINTVIEVFMDDTDGYVEVVIGVDKASVRACLEKI